MAPREDLNLPDGEQSEAKDTSVEGAEASAVATEDEATATAEINLVTEKGLANFPEASTNETKNIAAEISALLDAPEEQEEVPKPEEDTSPRSVMRKRITTGVSEEDSPGRRDSCFLTEIDEAADDEVFNPEDVVKNIASIDNFLLNQEKASEVKVGIQQENAEGPELDNVESIGIIEDECTDVDKNVLDITEPVIPTAENEPDEESYTPASIVDTILAKARASSVEETNEEEKVHLPPNNEDLEDHAKVEGQDNTDALVEQTEEESEQAKSDTSIDVSQPKSESQDTNVDSAPIELVQAANSIVDSILEKAKEVVIEKTAQIAAEDMEKETILETPSVNEKLEENVTLEVEGTADEVIVENPEDEKTPLTEKENVVVENESFTEVEETSEESLIPETFMVQNILNSTKEDVEIEVQTVTEIEEPETTIINENLEVKEYDTNDNNPTDESVYSEVVDDIVTFTEQKENEECSFEDPIPAQDTSIQSVDKDSEDEKIVDKVGSLEQASWNDESLKENKEFIEDIKKEFKEVFVEPKNIESQSRVISKSTENLYHVLDNLPLAELAVATLVIFLALIIFN